MKKTLKIITVVAVVCMLVLSMAAAAFAAGSEEATVEVSKAVDGNGAAVELTYSEVAADVQLTAAVAAEEVPEAANQLTVVWQENVTSPVLPVTITFAVDGVAADQTVYVYHFNGTEWELVGQGVGPNVTVTFTSLSPVALVVKNAAAAPVSPKTGASVVLLGLAFTAILGGGVAAGTSLKKKA